MWKLIKLILLGHDHKWAIVREGQIFDGDHPSSNATAIGYYYNLRCEKCGNIKRIKTYS
jgi:hypothetical protein